jgi:hypothetical protein
LVVIFTDAVLQMHELLDEELLEDDELSEDDELLDSSELLLETPHNAAHISALS